jgi:hypothetical protein
MRRAKAFFEKDGYVSLWVHTVRPDPGDTRDVLIDCCGVDRYDIEEQESGGDWDTPSPVSSLISQLSYSSSFFLAAVQGAKAKGVEEAFAVLAQFNFAYDPTKVTRPVEPGIIFIGFFPWNDEDDEIIIG